MNIKQTILILTSFFIGNQITHAQIFGNEWINYNQTYYKFPIVKDSVYRVSVAQLTSLGMPSTVNGENLQLFRDGVEVPIYVSQSGSLTGADFIEFYGKKADGKLDSRLYKNQNLQLNPNLNLISDTAFYFITYNASNNNKRFALIANDLSNAPLKEDYFWDKIRLDFRSEFVNGKSDPIGTNIDNTTYYNLNSSQYEEEGYVRRTTTTSDSLILTCTNPYTIPGGPFGVLNAAVVGKSFLQTHGIRVYANSNLLADSTYGAFDIKRFNVGFPMSYLTTQNRVSFRFTPYLGSGTLLDRFGISYLEFSYPRTFNFNNQQTFYFELNPKIGNYYIEINNFDNGGNPPRLYDLSSEKYIIGDINTSGIIRFVIPGSNVQKKFVLQNSSNANLVNGITKTSFATPSIASNQGDYIIVTPQNYKNDGSGNNYIEDYRTYRNSISGGSFQAVVADIESIYDEFGYGYSFSPLALKNYLNYAYSNWSTKPKYVFLIGKGIDYKYYQTYSTTIATSPSNYPFSVIPSFGHPCSDHLLTDFDKNDRPKIPIGRLSAFNPLDIKNYLDKVKEYEQVSNNTNNQTSTDKLWMKRILHIAGGSNASQQAPILGALTTQENIIKSPFFGGEVTTIKKSSTSAIETINSTTIDNLVNSGLGLIQFYGHSSSEKIEYNLNEPSIYSNSKRYPMFIVNGCFAGNIFNLATAKGLSEKWVLSPNSGSIGFIASINTGFTSSLGDYTNALYDRFSKSSYGKSIGEQMRSNIDSLIGFTQLGNNFLFKMHAEQIQLNGDPAIKIYNFGKPDYAVEEQGVIFKQANLTTTLDTMDLDVLVYNLGKYVNDSVNILIKRVRPNGLVDEIYNKNVIGFSNTDTISLRIPVLGNLGLGINSLQVSIDNELIIDEISETNNKIIRAFSIYNDDLVPVYPYDFSIVSNQGVTMKGSTLNPFAPERVYVMQMDTTELFNSPKLLTTRISSKGGLVKWQPNTTLIDSTVYYWRTAMDTLYGANAHKWSNSSFIFLSQSLPGWNQSHYYQYKKDQYSKLYVDTASREFKFESLNKKLKVQNTCLYGPLPFQYKASDYFSTSGGVAIAGHGCDAYPIMQSLQFIIFDTTYGEPWKNTAQGGAGRFGSITPCGSTGTDNFFEFPFTSATSRKVIMDFLDSIPTGTYMLMQPRLSLKGFSASQSNNIFIKDWKKDTSIYGANNSLYHKIYNLGFTSIDSFTMNRPMLFWQRMNMPNTIKQHIGIDSTVKLIEEFDYKSTSYDGEMISTIIGPAKTWSNYIKRGESIEATSTDSVKVDIIGIDSNNTKTIITTVISDTSLAFIDAHQYPYLQLSLHSQDNTFKTPEQMKTWRIHYQPVPEAALNPNRYYSFTDTMGQGQIRRFSSVIENLTDIPMDSMLVKYSMIDSKNARTLLGYKRHKPLPGLDTLLIDFEVNASNFSGNNTFEIEVNPNKDQLEQFHPNNIGLKELFIVPDNTNPLIDVTFDGVHILDKDIVSAKPFINILLKDENKYLALDDTTLVQVYLKYPGDNLTEVQIPFDGKILKFIPANLVVNNGKNNARIEFRPEFMVDGNDYVLIVKAKDKAGNGAGVNAYKIGFAISNKPSISAMVNYPNPFTTSTQFVFTLTGSEVPSNMKIQILSSTGKVVREILKSELGDIHIGRNITEFKWKGDDQFGAPLANGVYLYRFITNLHGNKMDHYDSGADKWMEKGFGKLYIMR